MTTEIIRTNDSGIPMSETKLPAAEIFPSAPPAPPAPAPPPEPAAHELDDDDVRSEIANEDRIERRKLIMQLHGYYHSERFGKYLKKLGLVDEDTDSMTIPEMKQLLSDITFTIKNKNMSRWIHKSVPQIIAAVEPLVSRIYDIRGLAVQLNSSEEFKDVLEECALESRVFVDTPPTTRLAWEIAKTAFMVHEQNAAIRKLSIPEKPVKVSSDIASLIS